MSECNTEYLKRGLDRLYDVIEEQRRDLERFAELLDSVRLADRPYEQFADCDELIEKYRTGSGRTVTPAKDRLRPENAAIQAVVDAARGCVNPPPQFTERNPSTPILAEDYVALRQAVIAFDSEWGTPKKATVTGTTEGHTVPEWMTRAAEYVRDAIECEVRGAFGDGADVQELLDRIPSTASIADAFLDEMG